ncbi:MAG: hemoglobin [Rhizobacter sp.]|nr:hemoglobin [Ferruginibacter sp.]
MTAQQVLLVKSSWKIFQSIDPVLIGDVFYSKLFSAMPKLKNMFTTSTEEQSKKLIEMLNIIVGRLDRLDELTEDIRQLAIRHVDYGVKPAHYDAVGSALLWTMQKGLGLDWNKNVEEAWAACYTLLSKTMMEAAGYTKYK